MTAAALVAVLLGAAAQEPVQVDASLSADRIVIGAATTLTITATARGGGIQIRNPALPAALDVVGSSEFTETRGSLRDGLVRVVRREIVIAPRAPGAYRIPAAVITVGGTSYYTQPLLLRVGGSPPAAGAGADAEAGARTSLHVRLYPDTVYVGQQVVMHAEVTFAEQQRLRQSRPPAFEPPAPSGFWVQDLPDPVTISLRVRDGRTVESQTFRRAYFPLTAGEFAFPPAHLHYEVRRGFLSPPESRRVSSDSAHVLVLPLPQHGQPGSFVGAVGRLDMAAAVSPQRLVAGDAAVLTVELYGRGNIRALPQPQLPELPGVQLYPTTQEAHVDVESDVVGGRKQFRWVLVPAAPGTIVIPPIEYGVFDPDLRSYVVIRTDTLRLEATAIADAVEADTLLRPLRTAAGRAAAEWTGTPVFAALQAVPLLLVGAGLLVRRRRARPPGPRQHERRIRAGLAALRAHAGDDSSTELERLLCDAVRCIAQAPGDDPVAALRARGRSDAAGRLAALLADLRRHRYAPAGERGSVAPLFDRADGLIDELAPPRRWRRGAASAVIVVLALGIVAGGAVRGLETGAFAAGVAAYQAEDYAEAAARFREYVRSTPDDPNGWYNLGLAAWQAGDRGRGVWAWLRGVRHAPRDGDLHHNLRLTASADAVARAVPLDRLARGERLAVAAVAWWLLVFGFGLGAASRRRAGLLLSTAAGVALLVLAIAAVFAAAAPHWVAPLGTGADLFAGPSVREQTVARLEPGQLARVVERRDEWLRVRIAAGRDAWLERAAAAGL